MLKVDRFETLTNAELELVTVQQRAQQALWRSVPEGGEVVEVCGAAFLVLPGVFPPRGDTRLVVDSMTVPKHADVLDMGAGSGALAVFAAMKGAKRVLAVDINPAAVRNAARNAERHGLSARIETRVSNAFAAVDARERFDLILANLPGRNETASDLVGAAQWDTGFNTHKAFFAAAPAYLKKRGRIVMAKANYPELNTTVALAKAAGLDVMVMARKKMPGDDPRTYYVLGFTLA